MKVPVIWRVANSDTIGGDLRFKMGQFPHPILGDMNDALMVEVSLGGICGGSPGSFGKGENFFKVNPEIGRKIVVHLRG